MLKYCWSCWLLPSRIPLAGPKIIRWHKKPRDHFWVVKGKRHPRVSVHSLEKVSLFWCCLGVSWRFWWLFAGPACSQLCSKDVTAASLKYKLSSVQVMSATHHVWVLWETGRSLNVCVHRQIFIYLSDICKTCFWAVGGKYDLQILNALCTCVEAGFGVC